MTAFLEGERIADGGEDDTPEGRTPTLIVERVAPNGTVVETMAVYGNETVRVTQGNATNATG